MTQLKYFLNYIAEVFLEQKERFILWLPVLIAIGVGGYFSLSFEPPLWASVTCLIILAILLSMLRRVPLYNSVILAMFLIVLGFTSAGFRTININSPMLEKRTGPVMVIGTIAEIDALPENKGWRVILSDLELEKISKAETPNRVRVQLYKKAVEISPVIGQRISILSILNAPSSPVMPNAFDFRRYMFFENIGGTGFAIGKVTVLENNTKPASAFDRFWEDKRVIAGDKITKSLPDNYIVSSLVKALLTGERKEITEATWEDIRTAGLAHLLAISGLHIGLVAGFLFFSIRAMLALSEYMTLHFSIKKISAAMALIGTISYLLLVGMPVSAQRATIMTGIVLIAVMLDREGMTLRLAAIAACVILLTIPEALLGAGFHMSFAAVVALIAFYEALSPRWRVWYQNSSSIHRIALYLFGSVLTTIIASLATAPFSLFHFHRVADEMSLLANILSVPLTSFIVMPAGLIALILMPFGLETIPLQIMGKGVGAIYNVAHDITNRGDHMIYSPAWSMQSLLFMIAGGLWLSIWRKKLRLFGFVPIVIGIILAVPSASKMQPDIYIADTGDVMAVRLTEEVFALSSIYKNSFVTESWRRRAGKEHVKPKKWPVDGNIYANKDDSIDDNFFCDWIACSWTKAGYKVVFVRNPIAFLKLCSVADVLIAPKDVIPRKCKPKYSIDRFDLLNDGAYALYIDENNINVQTVADNLGNRYWTPKRFVKWKSN